MVVGTVWNSDLKINH